MPRTFFDTHCHLIPGVDDGAMDLNMAQSMAIDSFLQGTAAIIATPHSSAFLSWPEEVAASYRALQQSLAGMRLKLPVYLGCEVRCSALNTAYLEQLEKGILPTMNGTGYVLAEFSTGIPEAELLECADQLLRRNYIPIIAHAERYGCMTAELGKKLKQMGCTIQLNLYSLANESDEGIRSRARCLVREKLVDYLGTDAHNTLHRPPVIRDGVAWLEEEFPDDPNYLEGILWENARKSFHI